MTITAALDRKNWTGQPYIGKDMTYDVPWIVKTTDLNEGASAIRDSGVLPRRGDALPEDTYCSAFTCALKRDEIQPLIWRAVITYKPDSLDEKEREKQQFPNPCERPAEIEWDSVGYEVVVDKTVEDYTPPGRTLIRAGTAIVNTALDEFDPPVTETEYYWTASFTKMLPAVPGWVMGFAGRVNNSDFMIDGILVPEGCARMIGLHIGKRQRENGFPFRELRGTIEFRTTRETRFTGDSVPTPFITEIKNQGYHFGSVSTARGRIRTPVFSSTGVVNETATDPVCAVPWPLDSAGQPIEDPDFDNTYFLQFRTKRTADFSVLPLA